MAKFLGEGMTTKVTRVVDGKPQRTFYQQQAKHQEEVREYLETPQPYSTVQDEGTAVEQRTTLNFVGAGVTVTDDATNEKTTVTIPGGHTIEDEGTPLTARASLNFTGAGVTATDGGGKTVVTIPGTIIEDEGTPLTQRTNINFTGDGVAAADSGGKTVITIDGKHGDRVLMLGIGVSLASVAATNPTLVATTGTFYWTNTASQPVIGITIPLRVGDRIKSVKAYVREMATTTVSLRCWKIAMATGTPTQLGATQTTPGAGTVDATLTVSGLTETVAAGTSYHAAISFNNVGTSARCYGIEVTYDRP